MVISVNRSLLLSFFASMACFALGSASALADVATAPVPVNAVRDIELQSDVAITGRVDLSLLSPEVQEGIKAGNYKVISYIHVPNDLWYVHPFRVNDLGDARFPRLGFVKPSAKSLAKATKQAPTAAVTDGSFRIRSVNRVGWLTRDHSTNICDRCDKLKGKGSADCFERIEAAEAVAVFVVPVDYSTLRFCGRALPNESKAELHGSVRAAQSLAYCLDQPVFLSDVIDASVAYGVIEINPDDGEI